MITFTVKPTRPSPAPSPVPVHVPSKRARRRANRNKRTTESVGLPESPPVIPSPPVKPQATLVVPKSKLHLAPTSRDEQIVARLKALGVKLWSEDPECY